jgi:hypothetical protein
MRAQPRRSHCSSQLINFHRLPSTPRARGIVAADFDRNGWIDLAHANFGSNPVTILLNQRRSDPAFVRAMDVPVGAGPFDLATGDFNCDGIVDLAVANADAHTISILTGRSSGGFTRVDLPAPRGPRGIDAAHVNDDGRIDLIVTGWESGTVQVLMGNGAGGFATGPAFSGYAPHPQGVDTADFNRDGHPDLVIAYESAGGIAGAQRKRRYCVYGARGGRCESRRHDRCRHRQSKQRHGERPAWAGDPPREPSPRPATSPPDLAAARSRRAISTTMADSTSQREIKTPVLRAFSGTKPRSIRSVSHLAARGLERFRTRRAAGMKHGQRISTRTADSTSLSRRIW